MAPSVRRRRWKAFGKLSNADLSSSPPKMLKFCKVIVNPRSDRLRIPLEFARKYGAYLPKRVCLRAPIGPEFEVELIGFNGEMWLHKGWVHFKEHYSLEFGYFLVFQYDAEFCKFHVLIFDGTASEIEYPTQKPVSFVMVEYNSDDDDDSRPILKRPFPNRRARVRISHEVCDNAGMLLSNSRKRRKGEKAIDKNASVAYQRAKAFKSANPHFISLMQPSYISGVTVLSIPASFMKMNMPSKSNQIQLRNRDGKEWAVKCKLQPPNIGRFSCGWRQFVADNGLKLGDVCVFEISETSKYLWNVIIFRS